MADSIPNKGQDSGQQWARRAELAWPSQAFAEPTPQGTRIQPIRNVSQIQPEQEFALYADWQTRDSELGLALLDEEKFDLIKTTSLLRTSLQRRVRSLSIARTRYQALETINAGEPNPSLRYSGKVFEGITSEIAKLSGELTYLQRFAARVESLHLLLTRLIDTPEAPSALEQHLRLLGQSWRGLMRVTRWCQRNPVSSRNAPVLTVFQPDYMNFAGYIITVPGIAESLIITKETGCYLLAQLEIIARLAEEVERPGNVKSENGDNWFPQLALVRAIVEFFYFCNFELPFAYGQLVLDGIVTDKIWSYQDEWVAAREDKGSVRSLKRSSSDVASLLVEHERLLRCQTEAQLAELLNLEARPLPPDAPAQVLYQPYRSVGLAQFEFDESGQRVRFHTSPETIGGLISNLLISQPQLARLSASRLGGPLETLLGLALLDERAFTANALQLETRVRYEQLARFWHSVGRRRAIVMLGDDYVHAISEALTVLGQPGPEHPTFLTIRFGAKTGNVAASVEGVIDPFSSLVIADQVRLIELVNITWNFGEKFLARIGQASQLHEIIDAIPALAAEFEGELRLRLNDSWLVSLEPVWALLRASAPVLWDFWGKVKSGEDWQAPLRGIEPVQVIGLLLRLFADNLRLIMIIELSGVMMLTRLRCSSEPGAQALYWTAVPYQTADPEHTTAIARMVDYYFDAEIRFDTQLAFASAFRQHLTRLLDDLKLLGAEEAHFRLFVSVIVQLEQNYSLTQQHVGERVSE